MLEKVATLPEHVEELAHTMQEDDKLSILNLVGLTPKQGLQLSIENSLQSDSWVLDGQVVAISGISVPSLLGDTACPWLLCSDVIRKIPRIFMEATREQTYEWLDQYPILHNVVWAGHIRSIRWLKWLGFKLTGPYPIGINGAEFYIDELRK